MASTFDLIVVGGGIIGCGIAERLRSEFPRICVIERGPVLGRGASYAAMGGITPHLGDHCLGPLGLMAERSRELFPGWVAEITAESGVEIPVLPVGLLQAAADEKELERLRADVMPILRERGIGAEMVEAGAAREIEPMLGPEVVGGLVQPHDLAVEPSLIVDGLREIVTRAPGIDVVTGAHVVSVVGGAHEAVVTLADGTVLTAGRVVVAAGHDSSGLLGLPGTGLFPVKGQVLEFAAGTVPALRIQLDSLLRTAGGEEVVFALPRDDGRIVAGVTFEPGLDDTEPTEQARTLLLDNLARIVPTLAAAPVARMWAGVRPGTADGLPVIGFLDDHRRVMAVTGHYGMGITLAPQTVELVVALLTDRPLTEDDRHDLRISDPHRFASVSPE